MKFRKDVYRVFVILLVALAIVACGRQEPGWKGTVTEKDGIVIVRNPKEPLYKKAAFSIVQDLKIGQPEGKPEYMFSRITDLEADADGNIYAIDFKEKSVRVFDRNGVYLRTVGRPGQGPGEFNTPGNIHVKENGEILVTDGRSRSLMVFSPDGKYLRQHLLKTFYPMKMEYISEDVFYIMNPSTKPPDLGFQLVRLDNRTGASSILALWRMRPWDQAMVYLEPAMSFEVMPDGRLLFGYPTEGYEVRIFNSEGQLERRILKDCDPRPISASEKDLILEYQRKTPDFSQRKVEFTQSHPPYRSVSLDDQGKIIVLVFSELTNDMSQKTDTTFDIFDKDGRYLARINFPLSCLINDKMPLWKSGKMYTVEEDEDGYPYIVRYAVELKFREQQCSLNIDPVPRRITARKNFEIILPNLRKILILLLTIPS